jgi:branched-chain amino acid transport system substrate-binding protein
MKRLLPVFFVILAATLGPAGPAAADTDVIAIGYSAPFTGAAAEFGNNGWRGVLLALEDINQKGILVGDRRYKVRIAKYDSACDPHEGVRNVHRMVDEDGVIAILGDHCSTVCSAIAPLCDRYAIPGLTIECAVDEVTRPGHDFYFRMRPPVSMMIPLVMPKLFKAFDARTAAFLVIDDGYGKTFVEQVENELDWRDVKTVAREIFARGTADFNGQLKRILAASPDLVFYVGAASEGAAILNQARQMGMMERATFIGSEEMGEVELLLRAGADAVEGTYAISLWGSVPQEFAQRVKTSFNKPMHYGIIFGYDAMHVLARAIENAQSLDPVFIQSALKKTDFRALEGRVRFKDFNGYRNQSKFTPSMIRWVDGRRVHLDIFVDWDN